VEVLFSSSLSAELRAVFVLCRCARMCSLRLPLPLSGLFVSYCNCSAIFFRIVAVVSVEFGRIELSW
jgi:hypothetical protein